MNKRPLIARIKRSITKPLRKRKQKILRSAFRKIRKNITSEEAIEFARVNEAYENLRTSESNLPRLIIATRIVLKSNGITSGDPEKIAQNLISASNRAEMLEAWGKNASHDEKHGAIVENGFRELTKLGLTPADYIQQLTITVNLLKIIARKYARNKK